MSMPASSAAAPAAPAAPAGRPWTRDLSADGATARFRVPRFWKCSICMEWLVAKTEGYNLSSEVTPLRSMCAPVVMQCCLKHKRGSRNVVCLPCFERLTENRANENGDHCPKCKLKISSWTRRARKQGTLVNSEILSEMQHFVEECGLKRRPAPFEFALDEDVADDCLLEADDIGVRRNLVDDAGDGALGLQEELAKMEEARIKRMSKEEASAYREAMAKGKRKTKATRNLREDSGAVSGAREPARASAAGGRGEDHRHNVNRKGTPGNQGELGKNGGGWEKAVIGRVDELDQK